MAIINQFPAGGGINVPNDFLPVLIKNGRVPAWSFAYVIMMIYKQNTSLMMGLYTPSNGSTSAVDLTNLGFIALDNFGDFVKNEEYHLSAEYVSNKWNVKILDKNNTVIMSKAETNFVNYSKFNLGTI